MSVGISIKFDFEQLPGEGEICSRCKEVITEIKYVPFIQIGDPDQVIYMNKYPLCDFCFQADLREG